MDYNFVEENWDEEDSDDDFDDVDYDEAEGYDDFSLNSSTQSTHENAASSAPWNKKPQS